MVERSSEPVVVRCQFSDDGPADAEVLVYSPAEPNRIFQRLRTDLRGRASFVPDAAGLWRVVADDGLGHRTELEVRVDEAGSLEGAPDASGFVWRDLATGGLIGCALAAWWLLRRRGADR